jgi:hypothetical protein
MSDRVTVTCPGGHELRTTVRGRSTQCPREDCRRRVYVRADGTTRHGPQAAAAAPAAEPFRWGRRYRWDTIPETTGAASYDPQAERTKLYDEDTGDYLGWLNGDPYELGGRGDG